jgi:hypothetical protein
LLNELVSLAPTWDTTLTEVVLEGEVPKVKRFVERWGPLWRCVRRSHDAPLVGRRCYWEPLWWRPRAETCCWYPAEAVSAVLQEAWRAKAVLEAVGEYLQKGRTIPEPIQQHLMHFRRRSLRTPE